MRTRSEAARTAPAGLPPAPKRQEFLPEIPTAPAAAPRVEVRPDSPGAFNQANQPQLQAGFDRIVDKLYTLDAESEYAELERVLRLSGRASSAEYGELVNRLDEAQDCAHRAMKLYANAKVSHAAFEMDAMAILGALRRAAREALETAKLEEFRKLKDELGSKAPTGKQITDGDIEGYIAASHPDEWRSIELRREKSKAMVAVMERFAELWKNRARDLQVMTSAASR